MRSVLDHLCALLVIGVGYSASHYLYMDTICGKSLHLKNYASGLDLNLTKSDAYAAELNCSLKLIAQTQHRVIVRFISLNIASFVSCPEDFLTISECAPGDNCSESRRYCGVEAPGEAYTSSSSVVILRFISSAKFHGRGFQLYVTTFHEGPCSDGETLCLNGRCVSDAVRCTKGDNCEDGSGQCDVTLTPPVIVGFVVGGVIILITFALAFLILWYFRKYRLDDVRYTQNQPRYTQRGHITPPHLPRAARAPFRQSFSHIQTVTSPPPYMDIRTSS
ncbi:low-density lipoprotein receptor-related protein 12-like [Haliotis rubra]|uniref:low-density lipoprotein receptor-related protein 12-like n=1 Tax=Haliotis rubra TaxID=36100 RepID=UPI001EE507F8|nr:low-density lipoprotein receptor-related protein 12-like [Haliotis rubra]